MRSMHKKVPGWWVLLQCIALISKYASYFKTKPKVEVNDCIKSYDRVSCCPGHLSIDCELIMLLLKFIHFVSQKKRKDFQFIKISTVCFAFFLLSSSSCGFCYFVLSQIRHLVFVGFILNWAKKGKSEHLIYWHPTEYMQNFASITAFAWKTNTQALQILCENAELIISKYFQTHKHFDAFSIKTGLYTIHHLCKHFNFMISFEMRVFCIENEAHDNIAHWAKNNVIGTKSTGLFVWTSTNYCRNSLMRKRPETQIQIGLSNDIIRLKTSLKFFWRNVFDWINFDSLFNNKNRFYFSIISV